MQNSSTGMSEQAKGNPSFRLLLIGNYEADCQESMLRFSATLTRGLQKRGVALSVIHPPAVLGRMLWFPRPLLKWLGYIDKLILFPLNLKRALGNLRREGGREIPVVTHIADHGNAFYSWITGRNTLVTCHDMLAVRGALGEDTDCPATAFGRLLQRAILGGLKKAAFTVCDSSASRDDLIRLGGLGLADKSAVVLLSLNHPYRKVMPEDSERLLKAIPGLDPHIPFILSVGSGLRRKNRAGILRIFQRIAANFPGQLVFAGEGMDAETRLLAGSLGIADRVIEASRPDNATLEALYSSAFVLLYPSRFEGFGWPIIEAQSCGCPVVCSDRTSIPEVAGEGALICDLDDEDGFAQALLTLNDDILRNDLVRRGYQNLQRFSSETMITRYLSHYEGLANAETARSFPPG